MKIGILSINAHTKNLNFACPLHSWAFQQFLRQNGYESMILDYRPNYDHGFQARNPYRTYQKSCVKRQQELAAARGEEEEKAARKRLERDEMFRDGYRALGKRRKIRYDKFQNFIDTHYVKTEKCYTTALLEVEDPGFDCYICATDVIWKYNPAEGYDLGFFLASRAMENKRKIAYAASRGVPGEYTEQQKKEFFHYLEDFDFLSVREESLKTYIAENSDLEVQTVLDPVLLHDAAFYEEILVKPPEEHYVLLYYVMEKATSTIEAAAAYAREHGMKIVEITDLPLADGRLGGYPGIDRVYRYEIGVEEWLGYLRYADYVFTNSFHATCFSILFQKEFQTGFRLGDKLSHLLKLFGLSKRKIRKGKEPGELDYEKVFRILQEKRQESSDYILHALAEVDGHRRTPRDYDAWKRELEYPFFCNGAAEKNTRIKNNGESLLPESLLSAEKKKRAGWLLRIRIVDDWFYCKKDGSLVRADDFAMDACNGPGKLVHHALTLMKRKDMHPRVVAHRMFRKESPRGAGAYLFAPGERIPYLPVGEIDEMRADLIVTTDLTNACIY
ncbi:MAG: polysaccharide pyruvyl transferase family protein [Lachnospiraceae bacterium]|nr:polysaccharide pyruvyl transferase family protein [Lachnospiraceae bacterium]